MQKGTKVSWTLKDGSGGGEGTVITDEADGRVLVSVEMQWGNGTRCQNEMHFVIWCTVTWLTVIG